MPEPDETQSDLNLSDLDLTGIADALSRETGMRVSPSDLTVLAVAPALNPGFGTDEFAVAARLGGKAYVLSGSETGWSTLDVEEVDRWIDAIERDLDLLRGVRRAAFDPSKLDERPKVPEDVQRWVSPIAGWHNDTVPTNDLLRAAVDAIVAETGPELVYLVGSLARGDARPESDIDLFVVMADGDMPQPVALQRLRQSLRDHGVLFDVRACRRSMFEARRDEPGTFSHAAAREGMVLFDGRASAEAVRG